MFGLLPWHKNRHRIEELVRRCQKDDNYGYFSTKYKKIRSIFESLIYTFAENAWSEQYKSNSDSIGINERIDKGFEGLKWAIKNFIPNSDIEFITYASFYIYCGTHIPEWTFDCNTDKFFLSEKENDILHALDKFFLSMNLSYDKINNILKSIWPTKQVKEYLSHKPKTVNFSTKYTVSWKQLEIVKNGDEQVFILLLEHYGDIVEAIVSKYGYLLGYNNEDINNMRCDGYKALRLSISRLPDFNYINIFTGHREEYWHSYVFAHLIWYVFFYTVVPRINKNYLSERKVKKTTSNAKKDIKQIFDIIFSTEIFDSAKLMDKSQDLEHWEEILDYLDERFDIEITDECTQPKILQLQNYASKKGHL
jgi:hypothetical protein